MHLPHHTSVTHDELARLANGTLECRGLLELTNHISRLPSRRAPERLLYKTLRLRLLHPPVPRNADDKERISFCRRQLGGILPMPLRSGAVSTPRGATAQHRKARDAADTVRDWAPLIQP